MKRPLLLLAGAAALAALAAGPAAADSRVSFGISVNSGYGGYYGSPWRDGWRDYGYRGRDACVYDPYCYGAPTRHSRRRIAPPPYLLTPPPPTTRTWGRTEHYDPMPRWRALADSPAYAAAAPVAADPAPATRGDLVRYDLAEQGYSAGELQTAPPSAYYDDYGQGDGIAVYPYGEDPGAYQPYRGDGAAESYIRSPAGEPEDLLLGGPR